MLFPSLWLTLISFRGICADGISARSDVSVGDNQINREAPEPYRASDGQYAFQADNYRAPYVLKETFAYFLINAHRDILYLVRPSIFAAKISW